jgi:predicted PurR-regulated permease PerM
MKTKIYVGIALCLFAVIIVLTLAVGFSQNAKTLADTQNQLMAVKQENYDLKDMILNNLTNNVTIAQLDQATTTAAKANSTAQANTTKSTTSTTSTTTTPTTTKTTTTTTTTVTKPKPKPVVTSAS